MPKMKWGGDIDADSIESAERREGGEYTGKIPPRGVYRFKLRRSTKSESSAGNPKLVNLLVLDGSYKPEHKKYDGCPLWDHLPVMKKTAFRVRDFCDALNISSKEFMTKTVVDDDGVVQKIGKLEIVDKDLLVLVSVKPEGSDDDEYGRRLVMANGYLPFKDEDEDDEDDDKESDDSDDDEDDDDTPF